MDLSIIIPTYNEKEYIKKCLDSIVGQLNNEIEYEVLISDGLSTDGTVEYIQEYCNLYPQIKFFTNKKRYQVYALNQLLEIAKGRVIIRCDAHSIYEEGYFLYLYDIIINSNGVVGNVGSVVETLPADESAKSRAIAIALQSKVGVGSSHRNLRIIECKEVNTLLFGAWEKDIFDKVGRFDETFVRGQDLEHNVRLKSLGYTVLQYPGPKVFYFARNKLSNLFNMMKQYASVKAYLFKKHRTLPPIRSFVPLGLYLSFLLISSFSILGAFIAFSCYLSFLLFSSCYEAFKRRSFGKLLLWLPLCFFLQHLGYAYGTCIGIVGMFRGGYKVWGSSR